MWSLHDLTTSPPTGTKFASKMPLTQEKRLDSNFSNNNDHSYLHKKFKKMASTLSVFPTNSSINEETRRIEPNLVQNDCRTSISNGSIAAAHPEIAKIKEKPNLYSVENNVQNTFNVDNSRLRDVNNVVQVTGQTSINDEFSNKTETADFDFSRDGFTGGSGGRYICPYCKLSCAKPSVLQKHIRAHTNERPYPCVPCGFAFKTKSNLYKHRRSRTHALRLQGADISTSINEDDLSGGSESDTSTPPTFIPDNGSEINSSRIDNSHSVDFSLELSSDTKTQISKLSSDNGKSKTIYKPKFRATFYQETDEKERLKKTLSSNADFLTEHISKIISDNEAIVDVIESPLQKKYGKIKQIAESKQFLNEIDLKVEASPLNLTKNNSEMESSFRKRSHSESFFHGDHQKHPLNPEGSIIKDLLLKTKSNGLVTTELIDSLGHLFICPQCNEIHKSADNLEIHRTFDCKVNVANNVNSVQKETKHMRPDNVFVRSNSVNVKLPETSTSSYSISSPKPSPLRSKPDNLLIVKPETIDVITPLPSPGPLLGNTRLVDTRTSSEYMKKPDIIKKPTSSPKRRIDRADTYSPRLVENISPRSADMFQQAKIRCVEGNPGLRSLDNMSPHTRHNSTSLQMFGGEVKIFDHSGSSTTLRIEPSKNQLSPILIQQTLSPSKLSTESEASSVVVRSGLHSGGTIMHNPPTPKEMMGTQPQTPRISTSNMPSLHNITHFQFPPLSAITAYNPLTLPPLSPSSSPNGATTILHGGKLIPHVPGIPGPNTAVFVGNTTQQKSPASDVAKNVLFDTIRDKTMTINFGGITMSTTASKYDLTKTSKGQNNRAIHMEIAKQDPSPEPIKNESTQFNLPLIKIKHVDEPNHSSKHFTTSVTKATRQEGALKRGLDGNPRTTQKESVGYTSNKLKFKEKNNYISSSNKVLDLKPENEIRHFNFENLITKAEIFNNQIPSSSEVQKNTTVHEEVEMSVQNERSETLYFQKSITVKSSSEDRKPKFLRPSTLPLKPGTFTPKRHHGITPNANTMPLVSPETPRPAKAYGQLYLNGNAYTYLGLKCSTKVFYCTINRPQPTYVPNQHFLSMYSNWQLLSELTPDPLGLSASSAMSLYDSRHRPQSVVAAVIKQDLVLTHSSQWKNNSDENMQSQFLSDNKMLDDDNKQLQCSDNVTPKKKLAGGFESNEEYTYVRGRGRGRYVCSECGIRCKKPSMLKKHIRTHTDVRPYTCIHCAFSFKTKGNLTKHMKSKAHYKKCCELGINPNEGSNDIDGSEMAQCSGETDDDTDSEGEEGNEGETESSDTEACKSRLPEHEAAHCLLSLGGSRPATSATPGLITSARPSTYPYTPAGLENLSFDINPECQMLRSNSTESGMDIDSEPMDLSKSDVKTTTSNIPEIPTARESSVLASLASNTAKLPQPQAQWANGEPMLHTYLTERALLDTKIKQSQLTSNSSKVKKIDMGKPVYTESDRVLDSNDNKPTTVAKANQFTKSSRPLVTSFSDCDFGPKLNPIPKEEICTVSETSTPIFNRDSSSPRTLGNTNAENAKHVVSEYLKQARMHHMKTSDDMQNLSENSCDNSHNIKIPFEESSKLDDLSTSETEVSKLPTLEHDLIARKVVIGVGGVAFKVTKGKEFENSANYSPGRLMEDGRRVCDFCNKTFTKPSQLRLHLNIHYMERPFRCSVCAVSFRTRGHLQKHERSGSHHNKVSMTSTFGAATSFNPRPFRCSDCNIAFRIHGHLAKHLRSKMHVMRLECLFKLPFGTFTEIERAGVSLTDIDTTDCASSLASLQALARELHEKDPTKLEYREPNGVPAGPACRESSEEEDAMAPETCDSEKNCETKTNECSEVQSKEVGVNYSATDN